MAELTEAIGISKRPIDQIPTLPLTSNSHKGDIDSERAMMEGSILPTSTMELRPRQMDSVISGISGGSAAGIPYWAYALASSLVVIVVIAFYFGNCINRMNRKQVR